MKRRSILAHRGWWTDAADKNSRAALRRALEAGFGIETDFRDSGGTLWVSHDPVADGAAIAADRFFADCAEFAEHAGRLALNIKADGLHDMIMGALDAAGIAHDRAYAFDMSVPDALGYLKRGFPAYTRISEVETAPSFLDRAAGIWVDNFSGGFDQVDTARQHLNSGRRVAFVSPELHGRPHEQAWDDIAAAGLHRDANFELCTDFPAQAHDRLGTDPDD